jgi:chromosome segregation ATPase
MQGAIDVSDPQHLPPDCPARTGDIALLREQMTTINSKVDDLRVALAKLSDAMASVVRLEVRHEQTSMDMHTMREAIARLAVRLDSIEPEMPALRDLRKKVNAALWALAAIVGMSVLSLVMARGAGLG